MFKWNCNREKKIIIFAFFAVTFSIPSRYIYNSHIKSANVCARAKRKNRLTAAQTLCELQLLLLVCCCIFFLFRQYSRYNTLVLLLLLMMLLLMLLMLHRGCISVFFVCAKMTAKKNEKWERKERNVQKINHERTHT